MSKTFSLNPRKPLSEDEARKIEEAIAAKGEGIAGNEPTTSRVHDIVSSRAHESVSLKNERIAEPPAEYAEKAVEKPHPQGAKGSARPRASGGKRAGELPITGVGTMHNPRVRKVDGVQTRSTTVHLPVELAKKLAVHCAVNGRRQSEVIAEAVQAMLGS